MNPELRAYIEAMGEPRLEKLTDRVYVARAYGASNFLFVLGDEGVTAIDSSWHVGSAAQALTDLRGITDKPIKAVIYSHGHGDHIGGVRAFIPEGREGEIPIYAFATWRRYQSELVSPLLPMIGARLVKQLDIDRLSDGDLLLTLGRIPTEGAAVSYLPPTRDIEGATELTLDGVRFVFEPLVSDIDDAMLIWLPDEKVAYAGDAVLDFFPPIETPRMETGRDAMGFVTGPEIIARWNPEHLALGHGSTIIGDRQKIQHLLRVQRDGVRSIIDQTFFHMNQGRSGDETAALVKLPPHLADEPALRDHYHRLSWMVKGIYSRNAGWYGGDALEMIRHSPTEEAKRMVEAVGGAKRMRRRAEKALEAGDPAWAAQLATYLLTVGLEEEKAKRIKIRAFREIASATPSDNERSFLSTEAKMLAGIYRPGSERKLLSPDNVRRASLESLVDLMSARFDMSRAVGDRVRVNLHFTGADETYRLEIDRGVFHRHLGRDANAAATVHLAKSEFLPIVSGARRFRDTELSIDGDREAATLLFDRLGL